MFDENLFSVGDKLTSSVMCLSYCIAGPLLGFLFCCFCTLFVDFGWILGLYKWSGFEINLIWTHNLYEMECMWTEIRKQNQIIQREQIYNENMLISASPWVNQEVWKPVEKLKNTSLISDSGWNERFISNCVTCETGYEPKIVNSTLEANDWSGLWRWPLWNTLLKEVCSTMEMQITHSNPLQRLMPLRVSS